MPIRATPTSPQAQVVEEEGNEMNVTGPGGPNLQVQSQTQATTLRRSSRQRTQIERFIAGPASGLQRGRRRASVSPLENTSLN